MASDSADDVSSVLMHRESRISQASKNAPQMRLKGPLLSSKKNQALSSYTTRSPAHTYHIVPHWANWAVARDPPTEFDSSRVFSSFIDDGEAKARRERESAKCEEVRAEEKEEERKSEEKSKRVHEAAEEARQLRPVR